MSDINPDVPSPPEIVDHAVMLRTEEAPTFQELIGVDLPLEDLAMLFIVMQEYQRAAKAALTAIEGELGKRLTEHGGGVQVGDTWVSFKPKKTSRFMGDSEGFWKWMRENDEYLEPAFNPNTLRKTGIPEAVLDTFFEKEESAQPFLSTVPVHVLERAKRNKENKP